MNKPKINYAVDFLALLSFLVASATGLIMKFLPDGVRQGRSQEFAGIAKGTWKEWHEQSGILLIVLVVIHLVLHWDWIAGMTKNLFRTGKDMK